MLLGHPVAHSLSPRFQNAALRAAGIPLTYEAIDVLSTQLPSVLAQCLAERAAGNVTVPHKEAVAQACARRTALADRIGAVNVFWVENDGLVGDNTDVGGFEAAALALFGGHVPHASRVALLGAGGSAAAVAFATSQWPNAELRIWSRTVSRAQALRQRLGDPDHVRVAATMTDAVKDATLVINATPVGLHDDQMPIAPQQVPSGAVAMDLVYAQGETAWVRALRYAGHQACDGLPMLLAQGALAFERWFGFSPDRHIMRHAIDTPPIAEETSAHGNQSRN